MTDADLNFGEDYALMGVNDGAPLEFEGYHFAPHREPLFVYFRHRGRDWRFQIFDKPAPSTSPRDAAVLFEERGVTEDYVDFAEGANMLRACLQRWREEEARRRSG